MLKVQRSLDFERPDNTDRAAEAAARPPPEFVCPDRQLTYGGADPVEWPLASGLHDGHTISVDRPLADIDGPPHRFLIRYGDAVEVYYAPDTWAAGQVVDIDHEREEVQVQFTGEASRRWFYKGLIYPVADERPKEPRSSSPLSQIIAEVHAENGHALTARDRVPPATTPLTPYTFADFKNFHREFSQGAVTFADYRAQFERLLASQESLKVELLSRFKAQELAVLASRFGSWNAKRSTKEENAASIVQKMLSAFLLDGSVSYSPWQGETYEDALQKKVLAVTAGEYAREFERRQEAALEQEKALKNPETFFEFRTFILAKGDEALSDEQLARYDALHADLTRERRQSETPATVTQFQNEELQGITFQVKEGFHDKKNCPLYIVQLTSRVERAAFQELNRKAKMLGGWYSRFKRDDAGFQFLQADQADRFCALLAGDADRTDVLEERKERKQLSAADCLHALANNLFLRAEATIEQSNASLQNTARRADIQAGVRGRAFADQAMSRTLHSLATALSRGEARYLDGIRAKTQLETLDTVLYLAKWNRIRSFQQQNGESCYQHGRRLDRVEDEPIGPETVRCVEFPFPTVYRRHLDDLVRHCRQRGVAIQATAKMHKRLAREEEDYVTFRSEPDIAALADFLDRAKRFDVDTARVGAALDNYRRLVRSHITDVHELRAALREYLGHRAEARGDDPVKIAEQELIGQDLPGFFPTPRPVIDRMLELAAVESHHKVLEPSCGKGDILDALACPGIELHAIEQNFALADVLSAKGHEVEFGDFLQHQGTYNRILMNPPFDADTLHIRHAYQLLRPGGRLVSVVSEGPFFRADSRSVAFRGWLEEVGAEVEQLPEDAFAGTDAFRQTSVRTRLITMSRPEPTIQPESRGSERHRGT